ncbi:MAG TPA: prepilin-type N-terminal cleavage/methylation domain-containing protein [bacterium]|nr:prepilin-type N-terminal cleavage/methylation domain-containing protein [bacterium]
MSRNLRERGLSLIEFLVASLIAGILGLAVFGLFRGGLALWQRGAEAIDPGEAAVGIEVVAAAIRESSHSMDAVRGGGGGQPGRDILVLRSGPVAEGGGALAASGLLTWGGWVAFVYDPDRLELRRIDLASPDAVADWVSGQGRLIASHVQGFAVEREGDRVTVTMTIERQGRSITLRTSIRPRNL